MKHISVKEYAKSKKVTTQSVTKKIRLGKQLNDVIKVEKINRFYLLWIN